MNVHAVHAAGDKKKRFSSDNSMDPGPLPQQLQGLTQVEEMLISAVMPVMCLYRLPLGQYGYSGHVYLMISLHL